MSLFFDVLSFFSKEILCEYVKDVCTEDTHVTDLSVIPVGVLDDGDIQRDYFELVRSRYSE
jgi:hypothetical protein